MAKESYGDIHFDPRTFTFQSYAHGAIVCLLLGKTWQHFVTEGCLGNDLYR